MIRWFIILSLILFSCKTTYTLPADSGKTSQSQVPTEPANQVPKWVQLKPVSDTYYIGIGNALLIDPDYQAVAKKEAMDDLASEISVTIESSSLLHQIENKSGFQESYRASIKAITSQKLSSYEQVDSWKNDDQYWTYYRLSKAEFEQANLETKNKAMTLAKDNFIKAKQAINAHDYIKGLHLYARCIEELKNYLNEQNEVQLHGKSIFLANEAYANILDIVNNIYLKKPNDPIALNGSETSKTITLTAFYAVSNAPVKNLPIITKIGGNTESKITNEEGYIHYELSKNQASRGNLVASLNLDFLKSYPSLNALMLRIPRNEIEIQLSMPPLLFLIHSKEENLDTELPKPILAPFIAKVITNAGGVLGEDNTQVVYEVEIQSNTRIGSEISGLFSSYLDFTLSIKDRSGRIVFSDTYSDIKGLHTSYEKAGIKAYQNTKEGLSTEIINSLNSNFFNKK